QRGRFVRSLGLTMAVLLAASEFLLPGWMGRFREAVSAYRQYTGGAGSLLEVLATPTLGKGLAYLTVIALAITGWFVRRAPNNSAAFSTMLALVLAVTLVLQPPACAGLGRSPGSRAPVRPLQSGASATRRVPDYRFVENPMERQPAHSG